MDKDAVLEIIQWFAQALRDRQLDPEKVILFGSYAKGTYHDGSDIDLVVISDYFTGKTHYRRRKPIRAAICELWEPIEAVDLTPDEWESDNLMICDFAKDGEVVYERAKRAKSFPPRAYSISQRQYNGERAARLPIRRHSIATEFPPTRKGSQ